MVDILFFDFGILYPFQSFAVYKSERHPKWGSKVRSRVWQNRAEDAQTGQKFPNTDDKRRGVHAVQILLKFPLFGLRDDQLHNPRRASRFRYVAVMCKNHQLMGFYGDFA